MPKAEQLTARLRLLLILELLLRVSGYAGYTVFVGVVYLRSGDPLYIGYLGAAIVCPALIVTFWIGRLVERWSASRLIAAVLLVRLVVLSILAADSSNLAILICGAALNSLGHQLTIVLKMSLDSGSVGASLRGRYLGTKGIIVSTTVVIGPAAGGLAISTLGPSGSFALLALIVFSALALVSSIRGLKNQPSDNSERRERLTAKSSLLHLKSQTVVLQAVVLYCLVGVILESEAPLIFPFVDEHLGLGVNVAGYLLAASGLGGVLGALVARRRYDNLSPAVVKWLVFVDGAIFVGFCLSTVVWLSFMLFFGLGILGAVTLVIVEGAVQERIDARHRPFIFSVMQFSAGAGGAAVGLAAAATASAAGTQPVLIFMAGCEVVLAVSMAIFSLRNAYTQKHERLAVHDAIKR